MKKLIFITVLTVLLQSCHTGQKLTPKTNEQAMLEDVPQDLWLSHKAQVRIDSVFTFAKHAHYLFLNKDTMGAEVAYEMGFDVLSRFSDEERETLLHWEKYDSIIGFMNVEYDAVFNTPGMHVEAEEIREEIVDIEEAYSFPDSVLFGNETVIDSSGAMPLTLNKKVRSVIKYFQTKGRKVFAKWLERSGKYEGMIRSTLNKHNVPEELMYLAMIESGLNPSARSYARAVGMWQFISATGKYYGLRHNWWFDERRDFIKATDAAARHLRDLNIRFDGHWYLAMAGYNCNPNRVVRNMRRYNTTDFWKLRRLPRQTRNYVPTYLAATIIAKNPKKFGFHVKKSKPIEVESVIISEAVDLNVVAKAVDTTYSYIKEINPAVLRWVTPPGVKDFVLYLPKNKKKMFEEAYAKIPDNKKRSWVRHRIKSGETLSTIAQKYHTTTRVIKSTNKINGNMIRAGKYLLIPVPQNKEHYYVSRYNTYKPKPAYKKRKRKTGGGKTTENSVEYKLTSYDVKKGDTLGGIAELFDTRASKIRSWNGLYYGQHIYPKQKLRIYVRKNKTFSVKPVVKKEIDPNAVYHTVRSGDTLWDIAQKYNTSISGIKKMNNMKSNKIRPGDKLKVQTKL